MSTAHEVITIQAGKFSNFIGTQWWNIQESSFCFTQDSTIPLDINHDVMFNEGLNLQGQATYTPRLVLIDSSDSLLSVRRECPLYRSSEEPNLQSANTLWVGKTEMKKSNPIRRNPYLEEQSPNGQKAEGNSESSSKVLDFNSDSTSWSDFLKTNLHPKSLVLYPELNTTDESISNSWYSYGEELYLNIAKDSIEDAIRKRSEECNHLQGFNILFDAHNCFSAITSHILFYLDDEYKRRPSICFPVYQDGKSSFSSDVKDEMHRLFASLSSMSNMNSYSAFFSPLSLSDDIIKTNPPFREFPFLQYNEKLMYHTSAILAATIETLTSPYRLRSMKFSMGDIASVVSSYGRKLVCSSACLPFPLSQDGFLDGMIGKDLPEQSMISLTPYFKSGVEKALFQSAVIRGIPVNKFQRTKKPNQNINPEEIFGEYLNKYSPSSVTSASVVFEKVSVETPFPNLFKDTVSSSGFLNSNSDSNNTGLTKIPSAASFVNSDSSGTFLENLLSQANKLSFKDFVKCSYEKDNFQEVVEELLGLQDNYLHYS